MASSDASQDLHHIANQIREARDLLQDFRHSQPIDVVPPHKRRILRATQSVLTRRSNLLRRMANEMALITRSSPLPGLDAS